MAHVLRIFTLEVEQGRGGSAAELGGSVGEERRVVSSERRVAPSTCGRRVPAEGAARENCHSQATSRTLEQSPREADKNDTKSRGKPAVYFLRSTL